MRHLKCFQNKFTLWGEGVAENVYEILKLNHPKLVTNVLDKSEELSKMLMLIYSHILYAAVDQPGDPRDIVLTYNIIESGEIPLLKIDMLYYESEGAKLRGIEGKNPIKRNLSLVRLLEVNRNVRDTAIRVVELLERWVKEKPYRKECGLTKLKFENQMFWKNLVFTAEVLVHVQWEEMVKLKAKFNDDEEIAAEHPIVAGGLLI